MSTITCNICCEEDQDLKIITCGYCKFEACSNCITRFLLTTIDIKCMNCNKIWNKEFFYTNFSKSWIHNHYKPYKKNLLFEREKSLMPDTQLIVEFRIFEKNTLKKISETENEIKNITEEYKQFVKINNLKGLDKKTYPLELSSEQYSIERLYLNTNKKYRKKDLSLYKDYLLEKTDIENDTSLTNREIMNQLNTIKKKYNEEFNKLKEKYLNKFQKIKESEREVYENYKLQIEKYIKIFLEKQNTILLLRNSIVSRRNTMNNNGESEVVRERRVIVRPCPENDCRGFLNKWKCGLCNVKVCKKCFVKKENEESEHTCKQEDIETANLLKDSDTKNCPSCGTYISKTTGCNQMWCPSCRTAFDWTTLRIETGVIHNPHYYEWRRNNGGLERNAGDVQCGEGIQINTWAIRGETPAINQSIDEIYRISEDIRWRVNYELPLPNTEIDNREMRIKYMMKDYDKNMFMKLIYAKEKKKDSDIDIRQILEMFVTVVREQMLTYYNNRQHQIMTREHVDSFLQLIDYVNSAFRRLEPIYDLKMPYIRCINYENSIALIYEAKMKNEKKVIKSSDKPLEKKTVPELKDILQKFIRENKLKDGFKRPRVSTWKKIDYLNFLKEHNISN